ncbi:hypothetical protein [Novosphingobium kaempferiae]|uniref:hypothetical protein n=1 Tax=Novosphingobium kaempferiae TaxID=2896849 RepID=UPI001E51DA0F|nr:hypothetical protein [Novosphingobium kaempferiae]
MSQMAILSPLLVCWRTRMQFPAEGLEGETSFEWLQEDGLMLMRSRTVDADLPPPGVAVICYDDSSARWSMGYHDDRGVSRIYDMTFDGRRWTLAGKPQDFFSASRRRSRTVASMGHG